MKTLIAAAALTLSSIVHANPIACAIPVKTINSSYLINVTYIRYLEVDGREVHINLASNYTNHRARLQTQVEEINVLYGSAALAEEAASSIADQMSKCQ